MTIERARNSDIVPPRTRRLLGYLPQEFGVYPKMSAVYVITDMFESIVLYDNRAVTASYVETPEKKFKVTLKVSAQKKKADGSGNETPMTIHDLIDVGVFSGTKEHLKRLNLHKEWITQETGTFEMVVDEKPTFAGIDPYNKLIDRNPSDNLIEVEKK